MATYADSGVDLDAADRLVERIATDVTATWGPEVVGGFGGFAGGIRLPEGLSDPVLMLSTDGVGTKADVARRAGVLDGLGFDLVAMCVDDLVAVGARPVALTDYLAVGAMDPAITEPLIASVAAACTEAGCALLGGETAVHPGVLSDGEFDIAGTALGVVEADQRIDGSAVLPGDSVVAVASPNVRSNGFSLIRAALLDHVELSTVLEDGRRLGDVLLEPSVIYTPAILEVIERVHPGGLAHITGGGIAGNLVRAIPDGLGAAIDTATWTPPSIFTTIASLGGIESPEMFRTFNMGVGFAVVTSRPADSIEVLAEMGHDGWVAGVVTDGGGPVTLV